MERPDHTGQFVKELKGHVDFITNCPEAEMGLGVPPDPVSIVGGRALSGLCRLIPPGTLQRRWKASPYGIQPARVESSGQIFFEPYPREFIAVRDSGKGRKI